jgi:glycosyltransferase involved in cell wall biosynthesis
LTASPGVASTRKGRLRVNNKNQDEPLHLLYLGRRHPLKGVEYLETAVRQIEKNSAYSAPLRLCVKIVSSAFGAELEKVWDWCDVLVLPTLSENFGLVIAEALERGKCVITTDGAPVWGENLSRVEHADHVEGGEMLSGYGGRLIYLKGYRDGAPDLRINLLSSAISLILGKQV